MQGLWDEIRAEKSPSMRKAGFVLIARPPVVSELKKKGQCVTSISIKPENLPDSVRGIAEKVVEEYDL